MAGPSPPGSPSAANRRADARYAEKDLATQCVHAGERWERPEFWPSSTPIHNATTFIYDRAEDLDDVVWRRTAGYTYSRSGSPTTSALERALSTLEGVEDLLEDLDQALRACQSG
jgi:O-acetylhomoserine/O-acetylserine sulfhydrylase-like pyridoxal-dependent enzyme